MQAWWGGLSRGHCGIELGHGMDPKIAHHPGHGPGPGKRDRMNMIGTEGVTVEYLCYRCGRQGIMVVSLPAESSGERVRSSEVVCPGCKTTVAGRTIMQSSGAF